MGSDLVLAGRSSERTMPVVEDIRARVPTVDVRFLAMDVADFASVRKAAAEYLATGRPLDVLINNAGVAGTSGLTPQGFDITYATNHLGPFLLTNLLLPRMLERGNPRIVNIASKAQMSVRAIDWKGLDRRSSPAQSGFREYSQTKLMNVLHAKELARRLADTGAASYSLHPGVVASDIWRKVPGPMRWFMKLFMDSNEKGAETPVYCATSPDVVGKSGRYFEKMREVAPNPLAEDPALAGELWTRSEGAVRQ
jgi:retinol dehydrogenase 12